MRVLLGKIHGAVSSYANRDVILLAFGHRGHQHTIANDSPPNFGLTWILDHGLHV